MGFGGFFHLYNDVEVEIAKPETRETHETPAPTKQSHTYKIKKPSGKLLSYTAQ
jgi:hypothetical protein